MHAATGRDIVLRAARVAASKLDPRVAETVLVLVHEKVPLDPFRRIPTSFRQCL